MTGHPAFMDKLPTFWAVKSNLQVTRELTTSRGPGTSFEFALSSVEQLFGISGAKDIGGALLMNSSSERAGKEEFNEVDWSFNTNPRDKTTTAHPTVISELTGEVLAGSGIVIDGKHITSRGLGTAMDFALTIVHKLFGHSRARSVAEGLVLEYPRS